MLVLTVALSGCKVADAPDNLEALVVYGFVNFDESDRHLEETEEKLIPEVKKHEDELAQGYLVDSLTAADLELVGVTNPNVTEIIGALGVVEYEHSLDEVLEPISAEDKDLRFENFLEFDIQDTTDRTCFLRGECDRLDQTVYEKTHVDFLGEAARTYVNSYRWVNDPDLPRAVFIRQLNPDVVEFEGSALNMTVFQQYSFVLIYDVDGKARRIETFWVDFEVAGMGVSDDFAVKQSVNQMGNQAAKIDEWLDENG